MAQPSIVRVTTWLETHLGSHSLRNVPVKLNDGSSFLPNQSGLTNWRHDGTNLTVEVEMLEMCQAHVFEPTLAHEYGHVLLVADPYNLSFTGGLGQSRLQEEEGFCEVIRYLWISENGAGDNSLELKAIKENSDTLYGDGFRLMWPQFQAAGSIMNLRADMLGLPRSHQPKSSGWLFGKKKHPVIPLTVIPPVPNASPTQHQPVAPNNVPTPVVVEGGSHRPMIDVGRDKDAQKSTPAVAASPQNEQRPTIDFTPSPRSSSPVQPIVPTTADEDRPIIRFD
jgi:hypothetical protein